MHSLIEVLGKQIRVQGGLVRIACLEAEKYQLLDDPETLLAALRKCGPRIDLFTFLQKLPSNLRGSTQVTRTFHDYSMEWDNLAVLSISTFDQWWTKQVDNKTRNMVRKSEKKGVVLREVPFSFELVKGICEIYNECPLRQGRRFPHYGKDVDTVHKEEATFLDSSVFIGAFLDKKLIGFIKLVTDETRTQAGTMNILSLARERDKAPTNALVAQAVRSCAERRISYLVYSSFAYGRKHTSTLGDFKERNGFQRIDLPRYYVPLSLAGNLAFRLGLHRRLVDHIPESMAAKLRELREAWYNRRFKTATEAL